MQRYTVIFDPPTIGQTQYKQNDIMHTSIQKYRHDTDPCTQRLSHQLLITTIINIIIIVVLLTIEFSGSTCCF